ncbi:MAG TPA: proton-conducting transporter membrane subunit [Xanthobacteraceae bacterium]|jgi:formate hydrogenlyase subunit 3/multisubunit Na+/H+ antiporter MnhD subunit
MSTDGGLLLVLAVLVPAVGVLASVVLGGRSARRLALAALPLGIAIAIATAAAFIRSGAPVVYLLGGWAPPLGVALRADALSVVMLLVVAVVICGIAIYAGDELGTPPGVKEARAPFTFWTLLLAIWASLDLVLVSADLFTLYVALELLTFAAVPLVSLDGRGETLRAALRYLLFALLGSLFYLLGTVLLYGGYGTLDIALLGARIRPEPVACTAAALMTAGLLAKTALLPLHLWLPPAHAGAPAPASATLSALVIKGSWFLVVRLWFGALPELSPAAAGQVLGGLGAAAIVLGSIVALRQERLKLLVAYSTVAQIGYLFLMFGLAFEPASARLVDGGALSGGVLQAAAHATAKAAMFMSAGLIYAALGHDRIAGLGGAARALPVTVTAFAVAGVALIGVPPSGAYLAKDLLLGAADQTGQWWWAIALQCGAFLTGGYVVLVLAHALAPGTEPVVMRARVSRISELAALLLALCSLLLGLFPWQAVLPVIAQPWNALPSKLLSSAVWPLLAGALLAMLLPRRAVWLPAGATTPLLGRARAAGLLSGSSAERLDGMLRQWPVACVSLVLVASLIGVMLSVMR